MKKCNRFLALVLCFATLSVFAQEAATLSEDPIEKTNEAFADQGAVVNFKVPEYVSLGETTLFDASTSTPGAPSLGPVNYSWDFGDNSRPQFGEKINYTFENSGVYKVTLRMKQGSEVKEKVQTVNIYEKKMVLISDQLKRMDQVQAQAASQGIWLKTIPYETDLAEFDASEKLVQNIQGSTEFIREASSIVFYDNSLKSLQIFAQNWKQTDPERLLNPKEKDWVYLYDKTLNKALQSFKPAFNILQPKRIILTRYPALERLFQEKEISIDGLESRGIEVISVSENIFSSPPFFFLLNLTNFFITKGVPVEVIYLLFAVPFIAFVIAFFRQFVGISTLGVYAPLMLTLSFMVLGLKFGFLVFLSVMVVSYIIRTIFEKIELLYIPKVALLLSVLSLSFFLILGVGAYLNPATNLALSIFPMLVMATLSEKFLSAQSESGLKRAFLAMAETVIIAIIAYGLVQWDFLRGMVLSHPALIVVPMGLLIWLGKFTGLRVSEYLKFRAFFKEDAAEE